MKGNRTYAVAHSIAKALFALFIPRRPEGLENVPKEGAFIICANHMSAIDPVYIAASLPAGTPPHFMAKKELFANKLIGRFMRAIHAFPVDRGAADLTSIRTSLNLLKEGKILGIFPQGTRSIGNVRTPILGGVSMIALRAGVPVIPVFIDGPYRLFHSTKVIFGKPVDLEEFGNTINRAAMAAATQRIEDAIWDLKPQK